jgi:hypothetical protein
MRPVLLFRLVAQDRKRIASTHVSTANHRYLSVNGVDRRLL